MATAIPPPTSHLRLHNRRLAEALVLACDPAALAEDVVLRDLGQERSLVGRPAVMAFWSVFVGHGFAPALTDIQSLICDEAAVALSLLYRGRNIGALLGLPPAEHEVVLPMVFICHIRAGCIQRAELYYNAGTLLRQLGLGL